MDRDQFWGLVEQARTETGGDCAVPDDRCPVAAYLAARLSERERAEVLACQRVLDELLAESYRHELWGAAALINAGCTDDGFEDFRGWLIGQGRSTYHAALQDPDSLVLHPQVCARDPRFLWHRRLQCQDMLSIAFTAYYAITGEEGPEEELGPPLPRAPGERWDFNDPAEMQRRYPRLWTCLGYDT